MKVKAAPGLKVPKEGKPREYILDTGKGVEVPNTAYYLRMVADGSLIDVNKTAVTASTASGKGGND